jgi:hypothetical protein
VFSRLSRSKERNPSSSVIQLWNLGAKPGIVGVAFFVVNVRKLANFVLH